MLLQMKAVDYQPGHLHRLPRWTGGANHVLVDHGLQIKRLHFDHLVTRHGTIEEFPKVLFSTAWRPTMKKWQAEREDPLKDMTAHAHYPLHYLKDRFM